RIPTSFLLSSRLPPISTLFPYTTLFRSLRIAQLLLSSGDTLGAEQAANVGLAAVPKFALLYAVKADALEKAGRHYEARKALEEGAANVRDAPLLTRLAATEDTYAGLAADV